jgi:hypothetical protein
MKYFAKYLPVEGEIGKGHYFIFEGKVYLSNNDGTDNVTVESTEWYHNRRQCKKVKLFLCSRDIQLGDTVEGFPNFISNQDDLDYAIDNKSFKVIGEISPEATFVKEGDEFEEYQEWWFHSAYRQSVMRVCNNDWDEKIRNHRPPFTMPCYKAVKVQCPNCKTLH